MDPTLHHCANNVLRYAYPVSERRYRASSLVRRSSYAYLNEIVEKSGRVLVAALCARGFPRQRIYRKALDAAADVGAICGSLRDDLSVLRDLRNAAIHENESFDAELRLYPHILIVAAVGHAVAQLPVPEKPSCAIAAAAATEPVVSREGIEELLTRWTMSEHLAGTRKEARMERQGVLAARRALRRLAAESRVPEYRVWSVGTDVETTPSSPASR